MESTSLTITDLEKMRKGEIPMTREGRQMLDDLDEKIATLYSNSATLSNLFRVHAEQFLNAQRAHNITLAQSSAFLILQPLLERIAEGFKIKHLISNTAKEVFENEKNFYELRYGLRIRNFDSFYHWLFEEFDRLMREESNIRIRVDYDAMVDFYGQFYRMQVDRRRDIIESNSASPKIFEGITPSKPNDIHSFAGLFFSKTQMDEAVKILREVTSKKKFVILDPNNMWLGKSRDGSTSVLLAWIAVLRERGWFKVNVHNNKMSELLNAQFPGLGLITYDDSMYRAQKNSTTANSYHADFLAFIKSK